MADPKADAKPHDTFTVPYIKGDWDKAVYTDSVHVDNLMSAMVQMGTEFWAMKRRMMVIEKLMDDKKLVTHAVIDAYNPPAAELAQWDAERDDFIQRVYSVFTRQTAKPSGT
jgi:hypothetical protein